jgi:hypothetical protein
LLVRPRNDSARDSTLASVSITGSSSVPLSADLGEPIWPIGVGIPPISPWTSGSMDKREKGAEDRSLLLLAGFLFSRFSSRKKPRPPVSTYGAQRGRKGAGGFRTRWSRRSGQVVLVAISEILFEGFLVANPRPPSHGSARGGRGGSAPTSHWALRSFPTGGAGAPWRSSEEALQRAQYKPPPTGSRARFARPDSAVDLARKGVGFFVLGDATAAAGLR